MRVLSYVKAGLLEWREAPEPCVDGDGVAIVRPVAASTCDADWAIVAGRTPLTGPFALGHEAVAEVVAIGDGVTRVAVGQLVVVAWQICCGTCDRCVAGLTAQCRAVPRGAMFGSPLGGDFGGLFSDLVRVPFADAMLVPLPAGVSPEAVASAGDNLTDAWVAASRALAAWPGASALVVGGAGGLALYAVQAALCAGASAVDYVDRDPGRLALAASLGARPIPRAEAADLGEYSVVIESSGNPGELQRALRATAPGGTCHSASIFFGDAPVPLLDMFMKDITFRIGRCSTRPFIPSVLQLVAEGKLHPERVTSAVFPWDEAPAALSQRSTKPVLVRPAVLGGAAQGV
ncbi:zinc-binding dehydrogenase [Sorangium sp. So ce1667]